jgi:hypothetical protein
MEQARRRRENLRRAHRIQSYLVFLVVYSAAIFVLGSVQTVLLALCQMTIVLSLINAFALRDVGVVRFIMGGLLAGHCAIGQTLIDAGLLIVEPLIDFIHAWVVRDGLRQRQRGAERRAAQACEDERFGFDYHDISFRT